MSPSRAPRTTTVTTDHTADTAVPVGSGNRVVFKHPAITLLGIALFAVCLIPVAGPWLIGQAITDGGGGTGVSWVGWLLLLIPLAMAAWILRVRTVVEPGSLKSVRLFGATTMKWEDVRGIRIARNGAVYAVRVEAPEVRLPAVTFGQLPRLSIASGGRVPDPTGTASSAEPADTQPGKN
ncbi:PH domain-containing protein [Tsukamurella sp. 8F]|uniref:PH domain-containing protein n=1 Tax=Tsukamurella sp. 8F TaxID=3031961 RepID=UPI0023B9D976|nr:PH domain-containing protein [Tsukamurella sp. 8F]MDF0586105.1 PH domain-containing protein [Tsukamurella sp. 8F]